MNSDFSNAKSGDKVWHSRFGDGEILTVNMRWEKPIVVCFKKYATSSYLPDGRQDEKDASPTLFHEKPDCFKTKVEKTVEFDCWFSPESSVVLRKRNDGIIIGFNGKNYYPAKATIIYEVEI